MTTRLLFVVALLALVTLALAGALVSLIRGRRPALIVRPA
jgi:hypothetical protein